MFFGRWIFILHAMISKAADVTPTVHFVDMSTIVEDPCEAVSITWTAFALTAPRGLEFVFLLPDGPTFSRQVAVLQQACPASPAQICFL